MRQHAPLIRAAGDDAELGRDGAARSARLPSLALRTAREGLDRGPVLVQVPRRGYLSAVACQGCRARARCPACGGPLAVEAGGAAARCRWCGRPDPDWQCPACGTRRMRAVVTGSRRTAEELRHAFPGTPVVTSGGTATLAAVPQKRALVVATPGAEPRAAGGYAAALLLDAWVLLSRPSLDAAQEAVRRWLNAAALVVPGEAGGRVVVVGDAALPAVQTVVRWDPVTHADRELAERGAAGFPPAVRMAAVTGPAEAVGQLLAAAPLPPSADVLGPIELPAGPAGAPAPVRTLVRVPKPDAQALTAALQAAQAGRSARKAPGQTRVQVDPAGLI
jgi:primosomal protein N' (replication factor Y)